jgi:hypothetical protein
MSVIPALRRLRQENHEFGASLGYIVKACLRTQRPGMGVQVCNPSYS